MTARNRRRSGLGHEQAAMTYRRRATDPAAMTPEHFDWVPAEGALAYARSRWRVQAALRAIQARAAGRMAAEAQGLFVHRRRRVGGKPIAVTGRSDVQPRR
jgi:hypothetical protein